MLDPVVAELLFTSIVTMLWCALMYVHFEFLRLYWQELIGLVILWFFWIGGAAAASVSDLPPKSIFGDLSACQQFRACQILSALLAFAWLGWITLTVMLIISIVVMITATRDGRKVLDEPLPSRGDR
ncbi:hypothetical protein C8R42DRAFT_730978 [Lentinula raphanica]|nr:hypothetical protein C8R42DRAFT_730978 [Lentinula raphanica]